MKRGVVASPVVTVVLPSGGFQTAQGLDVEDLNYYTLYWDKLVIPGSSEIYFRLPLEETLIDLGFLSRPRVSIGSNSNNYPAQFPKRQLEILNQLKIDEAQFDWNLHQIGDEYVGGAVISDEKRLLKIEMYDALPVPGKDIHPERILEFKNKYKDDYEAFHNYLDEMYKDVAFSPDEPLFKKRAYQRFRDGLDNINRISELNKDWFYERYNLSLEMPAANDIVDIVLGAIISASDTDNPFITGLGLLQSAKGFLKISDKHAEILNSNDKEKNLLYLAKAYKQEIIKTN